MAKEITMPNSFGASVKEGSQELKIGGIVPGEYTNAQMEQMLMALEPLLDRRDIVGYAAARNTRVLRSEALEYLKRRDELITQYGEPELGDDGLPTGRTQLRIGSDAHKTFCREIEMYANIKHRPNLFKIAYADAIGKMTGNEILACEWMLTDGDA